MKWYNGTPVGDGILPEKKTPSSKPGSEDCAIFMTYEQWQKKWQKKQYDKD